MTHYIHHIPGRLRLKFPQLKQHPAQAKAAELSLRQIHGVLSVETNIITGSLLVRYDATRADRNALLASIEQTNRKLGLLHASAMPVLSHARPTSAPLERLTDKLLGMVVEKCIERSAIALLGALL